MSLPPDRPGPGETLGAFCRRHYGRHPGQLAFLRDQSIYRCILGGVGSGKSEVAAFDVVRKAIRWPGIPQLVVARTYRMLYRSSVKSLVKVIGWWAGALRYRLHKTANLIEFPDLRHPKTGETSQLLFGYVQDAKTLRGSEVGGFWLDEATLAGRESFDTLLQRTRHPDYPLSGIVTGNPKGREWVAKLFSEEREVWSPEKRARYGFHQWKTADNPLYVEQPEYLAALKEAYGENSDWYRQEVLGEIITFRGLVYRSFDEQRHVVAEKPERVLRVMAGVDWGVSSPGCIIVVGEDSDGTAWVLDELYERGKIVAGDPGGRDWVTEAKLLAGKWRISRFLCDPSDANAVRTFKLHGLPAVGADNRVVPGIREVEGRIASGRFRVHGAMAPNLLGEIRQYHWRETPDGEPLEDQAPAKEFDHAMDALRYAVMGLARPGLVVSRGQGGGVREMSYER
jgi:PBSX family phage terminase large subunit